MLYKTRVLQILETDLQILTSSILSLDKHAITADVMKRNLEKVREDLEQLNALVGREAETKYTN